MNRAAREPDAGEALLDGVLRLFALVIRADHSSTPAEIAFVRGFLERIEPSSADEFVRRLEAEIAGDADADATLAALRAQFSAEHRLLLLLKTWELLHADSLTDAERAAAGRVAAGLGIDEADARAIARIFAASDGANAWSGPSVRCFIAASRDVRLELLQLGEFVFVRADSGALGERALVPGLFTRIEPDHTLHAGGGELRYRDLLFHFHHLDTPPAAFAASGARISTERGALRIEPIDGARVELNGQPVEGFARAALCDALTIDGSPFDLREAARAIEGHSGAASFAVEDVAYTFRDGTRALDGIDFEARHGELVCLLGPSGCGKSTLLNMMTGNFTPVRGAVRFSGHDLREKPHLCSRIGYVPQDDLLFENLTVVENLRFSAELRFGGRVEPAEIERRVARSLDEIRLADKRHARVGDALSKVLSGGQRKRLNIGLELLADVDVLLLDEPTSGLSSKDAERIIELLKRRTLAGQIVFVVAHQPSARLLALFDKIVLLDVGGKLAFAGDVPAALEYFRCAGPDLAGAICAACGRFDPDIILGTLETPRVGIDGTPTAERRFAPDYWQRRFRESHTADTPRTPEAELPPPQPQAKRSRQLLTLLRRDWRNRWRNRSNLATTFLGAPALGALIGWTLHSGPFIENNKFQDFVFLSVIVTLFFALSGSIIEFIRDRGVMMREAMLGVPASCYLAAKLANLTVFSALQSVLFLVAGFAILRPEPLLVPYAVWLILTGICATASGLFFSTIPGLSEKAATNLVPILLIPQILFAGSDIFPFEQMRHMVRNERDTPPIAQTILARWAYDGLLAVHARHTAVHRELDLHRQLTLAREIADEDAADVEKQRVLAEVASLAGRPHVAGERIDEDEEAQLNRHLVDRLNATLPRIFLKEIRGHRTRTRVEFLDRRFAPDTVNAIVLGATTLGFCGLALFSLRRARRR